MEKISNVWGEANKNDRHIIDGLADDKKKRHINNFEQLYLTHISTDEVSIALDWGCGGGLLAKELAKFCSEVHGVDVSKDSITNCSNYAPETKLHLYSGDPSELELPNVDLVLANAIVWHFPTLEYFKSVVKKWASLSPKYIIFNTKKSDTTRETDNYEKDFLHALFLSDSDVEKILKEHGYVVKNKEVPNNTVVPSTYYTFEKV